MEVREEVEGVFDKCGLVVDLGFYPLGQDIFLLSYCYIHIISIQYP